MKKSFKKSLSVFLAALMLVSAFSVMGVYAANTDKKSTGDGYTATLDASLCDTPEYAEYYAWTWNDPSDAHFVQASGGTSLADIYYEGLSDNVIFVRMDPAKINPDPNWDAKWNQTADLVTEDGGTYVIDDWSGAGLYGSDMSGHWETPHEPDEGFYTVKFNPGAAEDMGGDWYAWTWTTETGGHWVESSDFDGVYTFENICDNVIFANFFGYPDNSWEGKIGQTVDIVTEDGGKYVISDIGEAEDFSPLYYGDWVTEEETTAPETEPETEPETVTEPTTETIPTDPPAPDENEFLYVSAKSNINLTGSKVKTNGDYITVTYFLTAPEKLDDGQFSVKYDSSKITLVPSYNTQSTMFSVIKDAAYNLNAGKATAKFNFSAINGAYDFTKGEMLVKLVFKKNTPETVGTAMVYLNMEEMDSKNTDYINKSEIKTSDGVNMSQTVSCEAVSEPTEPEVETAAENNLEISASSNISDEVKKITCDKANVKVTYSMTLPELLAFGKGIVTYDSSKLALEAKFNTQDSMFTTLDTQTVYNLNAGKGTMMFTFTSADPETKSGTYDFRNGGDIISLVFTLRNGAEGEADVHLELMDLGSFTEDYISGGKLSPSAQEIVSDVKIEAHTPVIPTEASTAAPTSASETYSFYYLPSAEQEAAGYTYKLTCKDSDGDEPENIHQYTFTRTPVKMDGVYVYRATVPKDFDNIEFLQYQVYDGDTWVSQNDFSGAKLSELDNRIVNSDGTIIPEPRPTDAPTEEVTDAPTEEVTDIPTEEVTNAPTEEVTDAPTEEPTVEPTAEPTVEPTVEPTEAPTAAPTEAPTVAPTDAPAKKAAQPSTIAPNKVNFCKNPDENSAVNALEKAKSDADPKGSVFNKLKAKVAKTTKKSNKLTWNKVKGAKKYIVMGNKCGKKNKYKKLKTVKGKSFTHKKLRKGTYYKYVVLAVNAKGKVISASKTIHVATKGGKVTNYKSLKLNKSSRTLKKGKTFKLKVTKKVKMNKKAKVKNHRKIKFESSDSKIATVNAKGKIKAKKKGTCYIYAYAQNGVYKRIKIKVK